MEEGAQAEHLAPVVVVQGEVGPLVEVGQDVVYVAYVLIGLAPHVGNDGLHFVRLVVELRKGLGKLCFVFIATQIGGQHFGEAPVHVAPVGVSVLKFAIHAVDGVLESLGIFKLVVLHPFALWTHVEKVVAGARREHRCGAKDV